MIFKKYLTTSEFKIQHYSIHSYEHEYLPLEVHTIAYSLLAIAYFVIIISVIRLFIHYLKLLALHLTELIFDWLDFCQQKRNSHKLSKVQIGLREWLKIMMGIFWDHRE